MHPTAPRTTNRGRAVVTGATGGIGEAITRGLADDGFTVVMIGRTDERLRQAAERIRAEVPDADLQLERADLSLMAQVRQLAERLGSQPAPAVVISNAAIVADVAEVTAEGLQTTLATNHLAPYLLLRSLIEPIGDRPARFVVVGAQPEALTGVPVDLDDLASDADLGSGNGQEAGPGLRPMAAYGRTKNMNAMFVYALAHRLEAARSRITVNGAHPGIIHSTGLGRHLPRDMHERFAAFLPYELTGGPDTGADTPVWLATAPEVQGVTGGFFVERERVTTAPHTTDVARCDRLWDESARLVGLSEDLLVKV